MSTASGQARIGMLSPGQSCTDFMPASRSTQSVISGGRVLSSEVFPTPEGPKIAIVVLLLASARRWSAVMIARDIGWLSGRYAAASIVDEAMCGG